MLRRFNCKSGILVKQLKEGLLFDHVQIKYSRIFFFSKANDNCVFKVNSNKNEIK